MNKNEEQVVDQKVINKIRKILSLANGTAEGGEHERATAMKHALNLMAKHNLSMHDMADSHKVKDEDRITEDVVFRDDLWCRQIVQAVATLFFCYVYTKRRDKDVQFVFIGRESNVQTAKEMCKYLIDSIAKESRRATTKAGGSSSYKTAFRKGAAHKIADRAQQMKQDAERESEEERKPGTALVLASVYATEAEANQNMLATLGVNIVYKKSREKKLSNASGYRAGQTFGGQVGLNKQVS